MNNRIKYFSKFVTNFVKGEIYSLQIFAFWGVATNLYNPHCHSEEICPCSSKTRL